MYQVQVRTADGTEYGSCPAKYTKSAVKAGLKVYPNIARAHQSIKVELVGMDTDGAELMVYTLQGKKVEQQDISGGQATLYLPSGSYVVAAFTKEGQRLSEKLIVGN